MENGQVPTQLIAGAVGKVGSINYTDQTMGLAQQVALVVGGSKGVGLAVRNFQFSLRQSFLQSYRHGVMQLCLLLKQQGYNVYATCRTASDALEAAEVHVITGTPPINALSYKGVAGISPHHVHVAGVDLQDDNCQQPILQALGDLKLHLLLVVAGLQYYDTLQSLDRKLVRQQLEVNAVGPLFLVQALQQNLADSAKVRVPGYWAFDYAWSNVQMP